MLGLLLALSVSSASIGQHPLLADRTGIEWELSLRAALERARAEQRMLLVKPALEVTTPDGAWGPAAEILRAGPWSDERVVRLINRRFVPYYFDLAEDGAASDPEARELALAVRPALGKRRPGVPPVLILDPEGELLGEIGNYAGEKEFVARLVEELAAHPEFNVERPGEFGGGPVQVAQAWLDLGQEERALEVLADEGGDRAAYLKGQIARRRGRWEAMEEHFADVLDPTLFDDVRMERAYRLWYTERYRELANELDDFPRESNRFTEARYFSGLAEYHLGETLQARRVWRALIRRGPEGPWVYRADWAHTSTSSDGERKRIAAGTKRTLLGRRGYAGRANPDLTGPGAP